MLEVLSIGLGEAAEVEALQARPDFRKATRNMALAYAATGRALAGLAGSSPPLGEHSSQVGLVVGTCFGELGTTHEFLRAFAERGMARPLLFQNSLYHSITGFLAIALEITGPTLTVSDELRSGFDALDLAASLCAASACPACLVISVDGRVPDLDTLFETIDGPAGDPIEGAACLAVAQPGTAASLGLQPLALIELPHHDAGVEEVESLQAWEACGQQSAQLRRPMPPCAVYQLVQELSQPSASSGQIKIPGFAASHPLVWQRP